MRNPNRIPIALKLFEEVDIFKSFLGVNNYPLKIYLEWNEIEKFWKQNPDLRFGQLLCNMRLIPTLEIENRIWNIEETTWLVDQGYCKFEDINFWGSWYFKNGRQRKKFKTILLKDLKTDHIQNIIKWFENDIHRLPVMYLEYFNKRLTQNQI